jgi:hypothetical protein
MIEAQTRATLAATTVLPDKARYFSGEPFAREAMRDFLERAGPARTLDLLMTHGTMLVKAESVVLRVVERIEQRIRAAGFTPVVAQPVRLSRQDIRLLWLYVLNGATLDRLDLLDLFKPATTSILLICRDDLQQQASIPAAVRLQRLKGPTMPHQREPGHVRYGLGPDNRLLNYMHAADEPADVLRELGLLFDRPARRQLIEQMLRGDDAGEALRLAREDAYATSPIHDLEPAAALERLSVSIAKRCPQPVATAVLPLLEGLLARPAADAERAWNQAHTLLWSYAAELGVWDYVVVGSSVCEHDPADGFRILPDPVHGRWDEAWLERSRTVSTR